GEVMAVITYACASADVEHRPGCVKWARVRAAARAPQTTVALETAQSACLHMGHGPGPVPRHARACVGGSDSGSSSLFGRFARYSHAHRYCEHRTHEHDTHKPGSVEPTRSEGASGRRSYSRRRRSPVPRHRPASCHL